MSAAAHYAYLHSRVSVMAGRLFSPLQLEGMIQLVSGSESEIVAAAGIAGLPVDELSGTPTSLEQRLITLLLADFVVLVRALSGTARDFLIYWAYRFELSNLKTILRGKLTGQNLTAIRNQLVDMGPFARLPIEDLLRTEDVAEMLRRLEGTPFVDIARQARRIYEENHELFALDAAIDRQYFAGLSKRAREAEGAQGGPLHRLVGSIIDRLNLLWLMRYRYAYDLSPAEAYYLLIPASYQLSSARLLQLSQLGSVEEVLRNLPEPYLSLLKGATTTSQATQILERETWRLAEATLRRSAFNIGRVFAYLLLREKDLRHLRAVIRGRRMKLEHGQLRDAIGVAPP